MLADFKTKYIFLFLIVFLFNSGFSQNQLENFNFGFPVIKNYLPKEYKAHNQNWAITSDNRGIIYFGNSAGVLEFDGINWNLIKIPNGLVRSLDTDNNGTVFVGSVDDFGYLSFNSKGNLIFKSLAENVNVGEPIGHIWHTYSIDDKVFFFTNKRIFQFTFNKNGYNNPEFKILLPAQRFKVAHKYKNQLFVVDAKEGLQKFNGEGFTNVKGGEIFADDNIYSMLPYSDDGNEILIVSRSKGLFLFDGQSFKPFKTDFEDFIKSNRFYFPGVKLQDNSFSIGTISGGLVLFNREGKLLRIIDMNSGLLDNGVLYVSHYQNKLWLALQNGISMIDLPSPIGFFNQSLGLQGSVSNVRVFNNTLYAATTSGIYQLNLSDNSTGRNQFKKIKNISQESWWITDYKNSVIAANTDNVGIISNNNYNPIKSNWKGCYYLYHSKYFPNRIYVGLENGLAFIEEVNGILLAGEKISGINTAVRNIVEDKKGNLWLGTPYSGVYRISNLSKEMNSELNIIHFKNEGILDLGEVKVFSINDEPLFTTENKILSYNEDKKLFEEESRLGLNNYFKNSQIIYLLEDKNRNLWISSIKNSSELSVTFCEMNSDGKYEFKELSFLKSVIDFSNSNAVFTIFKDEASGIVWFCGADGIVYFNSNRMNKIYSEKKSFSALIRKVTIKNDSLLFNGDDSIKEKIGIKKTISIPHDFNSIRFDFSSLSYDDNLSQYQYKLEGFDNDWSGWTSENKKDYTNLSAGNYTFKVRAKNIYNSISKESTFSFTVLAPWYLAWYAYLIYLSVILISIYFIIQMRVKYLTQKNIKLEAIISDRTRIIEKQKEQLQELDELKSRFFTNISHEFRTPLTLTLGQIESVINYLSDLNLKKKLEMGYQNAKKLLRLINQLLEISKIESGKHQLKISGKNIVSFVRHILYNFESIADHKGISLEFTSEKENIILYFDSEKMDKVFTNLIGNSIKFTPEGGKISIHIRLSKELSIEEKDVVEIFVNDTGIGISEERLPYIFDRFYQADRADRTEIEGTGIGLTVAKELIELHNGKIDVTSQPGKGTSFKVTLLLEKDHFRKEDIFESDSEEQPESDLSVYSDKKLERDLSNDQKEIPDKESILIIDDNADIRNFIREQLEESYTVYEAKDGKSGFEKASEVIPNLIITDVRMPGMDGFELSRKIKESTLTSHIPVIILTAKADEKDKLTGLETGADDYLIKPFSSQELLIRVKNLISIRKKLRDKYGKTANIIPSEVTESSIDQKFLTKVIDEINNNISDENFNAEILASNVAISVSQLNRKLNALIGQPAGQFIRAIRMEKAAKMLKNREASIKEVAYSVGYSDQSNFARSFKKHFGITPGEYIAQ